MSTNFPGSIDDNTTLPNPGANSPTNNPSHAAQHDNENDAIKAIQTKIGTGASTPIANRVFRGTGSGTSAWAQLDLTTDVTGALPVANGGTGLTSLTIPASGILVGTTDAQDVTNKTLHDTFMGETFISQSPTTRNITLDASTNFLKTQLLDIGTSFTFEVPATSTLEIQPLPNTQSFANAQHDHSNAGGGGQINLSSMLGTLTSVQLALFSNMQVITYGSGSNFTTGNNAQGSAVTVTFPAGVTKAIIVGQLRIQMQTANQADVTCWVGMDGATSCLRQNVIFTPPQASQTFAGASCAVVSDVTGITAGTTHTFQVYGTCGSGTANTGACTILVIPIGG